MMAANKLFTRFDSTTAVGRKHWTWLGVFLIVAFLISQAPARLIGVGLPPGVALEGYSGTLWRGSAARAAVLINDKQFQLGQLEWTIHPWSLLVMQPAVSLKSQWGSQLLSGRVAAGWGNRISIQDVSASIDMRFIRQLLPLYIGGTLQVDVKRLVSRDLSPVAADGRVVWQNAVWTARAGDVALGNYVLELSGEDRLNAEVITLSGPLEVSGGLALTGRDYQLNLSLSGPATENAGLRQSLSLLAEPVPTGFNMRLEGTL